MRGDASDDRGAGQTDTGAVRSEPVPAEPTAPDPAAPVAPAVSGPPSARHDPARRAFFREFGRQALTTVGQVAGMADIVGRTGSAAAANLLGLDEPRPRPAVPRPRPTGGRITPPRPATARDTEHTYRSPYRLDDDALVIVDQRLIPDAIEELVCKRGADVAYRLRTGACRGGPVMAQVAAYGLWLSARERADRPAEQRLPELRRTRDALAAARASSRLPMWAMERMGAVMEAHEEADGATLAAALRSEADAIAARFQADHMAIAGHLADALPHPDDRPLSVLIHGDPGALAGGLYGTGITALSMLAERERRLQVHVTETRPTMEGARLASWELRQLGIRHRIIADSAVSWLFERETVDAIILAPEWIAADGAASGVIGSRAVALQASVASPDAHGERPRLFLVGSSTLIDEGRPDGAALPTEQRPARELSAYLGNMTLRSADATVPATDVVPPATIHALVTEHGVTRPVTPEALAALRGGAVVATA